MPETAFENDLLTFRTLYDSPMISGFRATAISPTFLSENSAKRRLNIEIPQQVLASPNQARI